MKTLVHILTATNRVEKMEQTMQVTMMPWARLGTLPGTSPAIMKAKNGTGTIRIPIVLLRF